MKKKSIWVILLMMLLSISFLIYSEIKYNQNLEHNMYITEIYNEIGKYIVWNKLEVWWIWETNVYYDSICDKITRNCLRWRLEGLIIDNLYIYMYIQPIDFVREFSWWEFDSNTLDSQTLEWGGDLDLLRMSDNIKEFWIFTQEDMNFYSLNEIKELPQEKQEILLDMKENPRFIFE